MAARPMVSVCVTALVLVALVCLLEVTPNRADLAPQSDHSAAAHTPGAATPAVYTIKPGPNAQREFLANLIQSSPGDVIELAAGTFNFDIDLEVTTANITIRGAGLDKTILSFKNQQMGSKGIEATGDNFVIEDLSVEDTRGNAIKVVGAKNVTFRRVRTAWTGEPKTANGAYGIYPVQCENVLIDECIVRGAADAGVYVGQSRGIIVKNCRVFENVAGIEIENSFDADVFDNYATNNSGGILVFDLPGLDLHNGGRVRVFHNKVPANNHANFGAPGSSVSNVAPGTGVLLLAMDNVEIFENEITDNQTCGLQVISYLLTGNPINDAHYDPYPEHAYIHDNKISGGGKKPGGRYGKMLAQILGQPFPEIFYDGVVNPKRLVDGKLPSEFGIRFERNNASFANIHFDQLTPEKIASGKARIDRDIAAYTGSYPRLPEIVLKPHGAADPQSDQSATVYRSAPKKLSEYALFKGNGSTQEPVAGVIPYDVNTPLFSDFTAKHRFVRLPEGASAAYSENDAFDFPVGSLVAKTFTYPHDARDESKGERLLETRILERKAAGWYGYSYLWNDTQTEATLDLGGSTINANWKGGDGKEHSNNYVVPHANQCKSCHVSNGKTFLPLGIKARNLNKEFAYAGGKENQLAHWTKAGALKGSPEPAHAPRAARYDDPTTGSVDQRARTWLDVNCAHCHNPAGPARTTGLDLSISQTDFAKLGVWKSPVAAGHGSGEHRFDIVPGKPDDSIVIYRLESTEPGVMMPELPRRMVPDDAVALLKEWIAQMKDPSKQQASAK
jgi:parallel beta-helix repeat protein